MPRTTVSTLGRAHTTAHARLLKGRPILHKYEAVASSIRETLIASLSPHASLPSERKLTASYGVSRMTVRHAIATLVDDGSAYSVHGSGTFAGSRGRFSKTPRLTSFTEDMASRGHTSSSRVLSCTRVAADEEIAGALGIPVGAKCTHLRRLRLADGCPMAVEEVHLPWAVLEIEAFLPNESLYRLLSAAGHEICRAEQEIQSTSLDLDSSKLLEVPSGSAALQVTRVSSSRQGRLIEFARTVYRADRYAFRMAVTRKLEK